VADNKMEQLLHNNQTLTAQHDKLSATQEEVEPLVEPLEPVRLNPHARQQCKRGL